MANEKIKNSRNPHLKGFPLTEDGRKWIRFKVSKEANDALLKEQAKKVLQGIRMTKEEVASEVFERLVLPKKE